MTDPIQPTEAKGAEAAYQKLLPHAEAIDPRDLRRFSADARLASHNLSRAIEALTPHQEALAKKLSEEALKVFNQHLAQAPLLAQAILFADLEVERQRKSSPGEIAAKLAEARELRGILLDGAKACARAKRIDAEDVRKIERGRGPFDTAEDCIALVRLYRANADQMNGATPATPEQLTRAAELGTELLTAFKPTHSTEKTGHSEDLTHAMNLRDRLWLLTTQTHEALWIAGALVFGLAVSEEVPLLQSRTIEARAKSTSPTSQTK